jgi:hypothetical protein
MAKIDLEFQNTWRLAMITTDPVNVGKLEGLGRWDGKDTKLIKKKFQESWAHTFRERVYPNIPCTDIGNALYCGTNGRPSKNIGTLSGLLIIKEYMNLTDEEAVDTLRRDLDVQYALCLDDTTDSAVLISLRTFWDFKIKVRDSELTREILNKALEGLIATRDADTGAVGTDSARIESNMKALSRRGIFFRTISGFLEKAQKATSGSLWHGERGTLLSARKRQNRL